MGYTIDATESGCYPGTTVLVNKFDLRSQSELDAVEAALVTAKAIQWEEAPLCDSFDFAHYRAIHKYLFEELYDWAGQVRTINISKKGTQFCPAEELPRVGEAVFARVKKNTSFAVFHGNVLQRSFWTSMNGPMSCIRSGKGMGGHSVCFWPSWRRTQAIGWIFPVWMPMS